MSTGDFGERKGRFEKELRQLLTKYRIKIFTVLETDEVNGVIIGLKPMIYFIDDSLEYGKKSGEIN